MMVVESIGWRFKIRFSSPSLLLILMLLLLLYFYFWAGNTLGFLR
jgi:hypothetical protein